MVLWPLAIGTASLLGLNWQASRELGDLGDSGHAQRRRLHQPWLLILLGAAGGLWVGVTWSSQIKKACSVVNILLSSAKDEEDEEEDADRTDSDEEDERRNKRRHKKSRRS